MRAQDQQTLRKVVTAVKQIVSMDPLAEATVKEVANKANYSESRRMRPRRAAADVPQVAHICTGTELTSPTSAPGLRLHLHRDWAHRLAPGGPQPSAHPRACAGDGLAVA